MNQRFASQRDDEVIAPAFRAGAVLLGGLAALGFALLALTTRCYPPPPAGEASVSGSLVMVAFGCALPALFYFLWPYRRKRKRQSRPFWLPPPREPDPVTGALPGPSLGDRLLATAVAPAFFIFFLWWALTAVDWASLAANDLCL